MLRAWRVSRGHSQLTLASATGVSTRHISFLETGKARPSREMVVFLAEQLEVPLRQRNDMMVAAGHPPAYPARSWDDPELATLTATFDDLLAAYEPYPAVVVDWGWNHLRGNRAAALLAQGVAPHLLGPPANLVRVSLHPDGLAPRIVNFAEWSRHVVGRVRRRVDAGAADLAALHAEISAYPTVTAAAAGSPLVEPARVALPLEIDTPAGRLRLLSTVTSFSSPFDVGLAEIALEAFLPADESTRTTLRRTRFDAGGRTAIPRNRRSTPRTRAMS